MKNNTCNIIILISLISIAIFLVITIYNYNTTIYSENFTPTIKTAYRPYTRNIRLAVESFYNKNKLHVQNISRKIGVI